MTWSKAKRSRETAIEKLGTVAGQRKLILFTESIRRCRRRKLSELQGQHPTWSSSSAAALSAARTEDRAITNLRCRLLTDAVEKGLENVAEQ